MPNGKYWRLERPFTFHIGSQYSRAYIRVPRHFLTDWASIPRFLFWLLPWWAKFNKSPVLHDWLYKSKQIMGKPITRKRADKIFYEAMLVACRNHRLGALLARIEYLAVRAFGFLAWKRR